MDSYGSVNERSPLRRETGGSSSVFVDPIIERRRSVRRLVLSVLGLAVVCGVAIAIVLAHRSSSGGGHTPSPSTSSTVTVKNWKMFWPNGTEAYVRGINYSPYNLPGEVDVIADVNKAIWQRDLPYLASLGVNCIRIYYVDPSLSHKEFMAAASALDIYVWINVWSAEVAIASYSPNYDITMQSRLYAVYDHFVAYDNLLSLEIGNELAAPNAGNTSSTAALAYAKTVVQDLRQYMNQADTRYVPISYAVRDNILSRFNVVDYLACDDVSTQPDVIGINCYEWCPNVKDFNGSGYQNWVDHLQDFPKAVIWSEYGCWDIGTTRVPRTWTQNAVIYGADMNDYLSGAFVFEYSNQNMPANAGIVTITGPNTVSPNSDYYALQRSFTNMSQTAPAGVRKDKFNPAARPSRACPTVKTSGDNSWWASPQLPPIPQPAVCTVMAAQANCVPNNPKNETAALGVISVVCGENLDLCSDISSNSTTATYGKYSFCSTQQKAIYLASQWYLLHSRQPQSCNFGGWGHVVSSIATKLIQTLT